MTEPQADPATSKRDELLKAVEEEKQARAKDTMERVVKLLAETNCSIGARPELLEVAPGRFAVTSGWGVQAL